MLGFNRSICTRVKDGDTFVGTLIIPIPDLSAELHLKDQVFRLYGVDTPEISKKEPLCYEATEFTASMIDGKEFPVFTYGKDSFGRWLTDVYTDEHQTLSELLLKEGLATIYKKK
jgi:endonuclease YncB( thermonuclease family)